MGATMLKMRLKKGPKWKKVDPEGPDLGPEGPDLGQSKKVRTLLLYQFFVPNPTAHLKFSKTHSKSRQKRDF